jgi:hypothetical protein
VGGEEFRCCAESLFFFLFWSFPARDLGRVRFILRAWVYCTFYLFGSQDICGGFFAPGRAEGERFPDQDPSMMLDKYTQHSNALSFVGTMSPASVAGEVVHDWFVGFQHGLIIFFSFEDVKGFHGTRR